MGWIGVRDGFDFYLDNINTCFDFTLKTVFSETPELYTEDYFRKGLVFIEHPVISIKQYAC